MRTVQIVTNSWNIFICLFLGIPIFLSSEQKRQDKVIISLQYVFILNVIFQSMDSLAWYFRGDVSDLGVVMTHVGNYLYFVILACLGVAFSYYFDCLAEWKGEKKKKFFIRFATVVAALQIIAVTVNPFHRYFYFFTEQNYYQRGEYFIVLIVLQFVLLCITIAQTLSYLRSTALRKYVLIHLGAFVLFAIVGIYQSFFYGLSLISVAVSFTIFALYLVYLNEVMAILRRQEERLQQQEKDLEEKQQRLIEKEQELYDTNSKLGDANLRLLIAQVKPHFIYNTITMIRSLCYSDHEKAAESLGKFAKFLRGSVNSIGATQCIPLQEELEIIRSYVFLQQQRFGDRLIYMEEIETENCFVPALSLQILVENAVIHGLEPKDDGGEVILSVTRSDDDLGTAIVVQDTGVGFDTEMSVDTTRHVGLENTRNRLKTMCNGKMEIDSVPGEGTTVTIYIPDKK